jgi:cytochrome c biogenesis protein CcmG/thiol:disulfide interchange protein DsbE
VEAEPTPVQKTRLSVEPPASGPASRWRWTLRVLGLSLVAALLGLLVWATVTAGKGKTLVERVAAGERPRAPDFELRVIWSRSETWPQALRPALEDGRLAASELRGHPVVINFWASWCIPCREEAPILAASARRHAGEVVFLGVDVQDLSTEALAFLREFEVPYVSVRDGTNATNEDYGLTGVPETYYLDRRGGIVAHRPGAVSEGLLEEGIAAALRTRR